MSLQSFLSNVFGGGGDPYDNPMWDGWGGPGGWNSGGWNDGWGGGGIYDPFGAGYGGGQYSNFYPGNKPGQGAGTGTGANNVSTWADVVGSIFSGGGNFGGGSGPGGTPGFNPNASTPGTGANSSGGAGAAANAANAAKATLPGALTTINQLLGTAGGVANLFGGVYNGIGNQQALDWLRGAYVNNLNFGRGEYDAWKNNYASIAGDLRDQANQGANAFGGAANRGINPYMNSAFGLSDLIPGLMEQYGGSFGNADTEAAGGSLRDILSGASGIFGNGGWTNKGNQLFEQGQEFAAGQNDPMKAFSNIGQNLLNTGGGTDLNRGLQDRGLDAVNAGGLTDILRSVLSGAQGIQAQGGATSGSQTGIQQALAMLMNGGATKGTQALDAAGQNALAGNLGVGGLTNTGAVGELAALKGLQNGGATATSQALQQKALEILKTNPTMSLEDAVSAARDAAATAAAQQGESVRARALARGGGPGSIVASGSQNQGMADFADQALRAESAAGNDARAKQQNVLMDYLKTGSAMGAASGELERGTLGTYADLLKGLEGVAASRFSTGGDLLGKGTALATDRANTGFSGLGSMENLQTNRLLEALKLQTGAQGAATSNAGTLGQLGLGGASDQNSRLNTGTNMLSNWLTSALAGTNLSGKANADAMQYGLGAGNLGAGAANNLGGLGINAGQLGQSRFSNIFGAMNNGVSQQGNAVNNAVNGWQNIGINPLTQLSSQVGNIMSTFGNNTSGLPGMPGTPNTWAGLGGGK